MASVARCARSAPMLEFDNRALRSLPIDPVEENRIRQVHGACFSRVRPTPVKKPRTLAVASEVAELLDLPAEFVDELGFRRGLRGQSDSCPEWTRCPPATAATSSERGRASSATVAPSRSERCGTGAASIGRCSSRVRGRRPIRAAPTVAPCCARRFENSCAARPWLISGSRRRARSASWKRAKA